MRKFGVYQPFIEQPLLPLYRVEVLGWTVSLLDIVGDCLTFKCETPYEIRFDKEFIRPPRDGEEEHLYQEIFIHEVGSIATGVAKVVLFAEGVVGVDPSKLSYSVRETGSNVQIGAYKSAPITAKGDLMVKETVMFTREGLGYLRQRQGVWEASLPTSEKTTSFLIASHELGEAKFVWDTQVGTVYSSEYPYLRMTLEGYLRYLHGILSKYPGATSSIATIEGAEDIPFSEWAAYVNEALKIDSMLEMEVTLTVAREWASETGVICTQLKDGDNSITIGCLGYPQNSYYPPLLILKERGSFLWPQGNIGKGSLNGARYVYVTSVYPKTLVSFIGDTGGIHEA